MGIARRGLDVAVADQFANHRERLAERQGAGREGVSKVFGIFPTRTEDRATYRNVARRAR